MVWLAIQTKPWSVKSFSPLYEIDKCILKRIWLLHSTMTTCTLHLISCRWIYFFIWMFGFKKGQLLFQYVTEFSAVHKTSQIFLHWLSQTVAFFTSERLNWSIEMTLYERVFRCLQDCFALRGKQTLVAHNVQSDIALWDKGVWGHKVLFALTELDLFYHHPWNC